MNIKELEFLTKFVDHIDSLNRDMSGLVISVDRGNQDDSIIEVSHENINLISAISNQIGLIKDLIYSFKDSCDKKYWNEWVKKYPHMKGQNEPD